MTTIKRYITETITDGETKRAERVAYVAKDGKEFDTPQAAYCHDMKAKLVRALGPVLEPNESDFLHPCYDDHGRTRAKQQGFERAITQMLSRPEEVIRLLELWRTNKDL